MHIPSIILKQMKMIKQIQLRKLKIIGLLLFKKLMEALVQY